ncbi:MAG: outer membrane beta-barrel protein [Bacteroidota bacterium]|jgi:hypothetical protein
MKITLLILACCIALGLGATAQAQQPMAVGVAVGANYNMHSGADLPASVTGVGVIIGGQADISFSKWASVLTTISFDNRNGKYSTSGTESGYDYYEDVAVTVAYLSIEPLFKYVIPDRPWYVVTGPCVGFPVQGKSETIVTTPGFAVDGFESTTINTTIQDLKPRVEWKIGGGYFIPIDKKTVIMMRLTYARGFTEVQKGMDWHVNSISFLASIDFTLGR